MDLKGVVTLMKEHERRLALTESEILAEVGAFVDTILQLERGVGTTSSSIDDNVSGVAAESTGPAPAPAPVTSSSSSIFKSKCFCTQLLPTATEGFLCPSCRRRLHNEVRGHLCDIYNLRN